MYKSFQKPHRCYYSHVLLLPLPHNADVIPSVFRPYLIRFYANCIYLNTNLLTVRQSGILISIDPTIYMRISSNNASLRQSISSYKRRSCRICNIKQPDTPHIYYANNRHAHIKKERERGVNCISISSAIVEKKSQQCHIYIVHLLRRNLKYIPDIPLVDPSRGYIYAALMGRYCCARRSSNSCKHIYHIFV